MQKILNKYLVWSGWAGGDGFAAFQILDRRRAGPRLPWGGKCTAERWRRLQVNLEICFKWPLKLKGTVSLRFRFDEKQQRLKISQSCPIMRFTNEECNNLLVGVFKRFNILCVLFQIILKIAKSLQFCRLDDKLHFFLAVSALFFAKPACDNSFWILIITVVLSLISKFTLYRKLILYYIQCT